MSQPVRTRRERKPRVHLPAPSGARLGSLRRVDPDGSVWLDGPGGEPVRARVADGLVTARLLHALAGHVPVLVVDEHDDPARPVVLAVVAERATTPSTSASIDGSSVELHGHEQVVLRCGTASITLTRDGRIVIEGAAIRSRADGTHRIQGGTVQIN